MNLVGKWTLTVTLWGLATACQAGGVEDLQQFLRHMQTLKADFAQIVVPANGRKPQHSSGTVSIWRPGKLRWDIQQPFAQLLLVDGERFWMVDPELKQVTVRKVGQALGATPAALLAGGDVLEKNFTLREGGEAEGMTWVEAIPKQGDSGFDKVRLGFSGQLLRALTLYDNFGQVTHIRLSKVEKNLPLPASQFRFVPPAGMDVVGE